MRRPIERPASPPAPDRPSHPVRLSDLRIPYGLRRRAVALGWAADRVLVIDEDQGHNGQTAEGRLGFQRLLPRSASTTSASSWVSR